MTETNEYDAIFAALKHPVRRQILLLLEEKDEASFTDIQDAVGIDDTGLMSYHLKELAPLVEQSSRGKYCLSEVGQTSITLFRKVESERQRSSVAVRREIEKSVGEIFFLFFIIGTTLIAPLSVDIHISVLSVVYASPSLEFMASMYLISLSGMILGIVMFAFYDRHYFSKNTKTNAIHSTIFAIGTSLLSILSVYMIHRFEISVLSSSSMILLFGFLRAFSLLATVPLVTFGVNKLAKRH